MPQTSTTTQQEKDKATTLCLSVIKRSIEVQRENSDMLIDMQPEEGHFRDTLELNILVGKFAEAGAREALRFYQNMEVPRGK